MRAAESGEKKNRERRRALTFAPTEREMSAAPFGEIIIH
jgi:hypothetical protein